MIPAASTAERLCGVSLRPGTGLLDILNSGNCGEYETAAHLLRVSRFSYQLAIAAGVPADTAAEITVAAPFHDIGKVALPQLVLLRNGPLTPCERAIVETHTVIGAEMLRGEPGSVLRLASSVALSHHERWDGSGYPKRLRGSDIPLAGRIVSIADQYDALRSWRPYKPALSHERVCQILLEGDGRTMPGHFDPFLLDVFRRNTDTFAATYAGCDDLRIPGCSVTEP